MKIARFSQLDFSQLVLGNSFSRTFACTFSTIYISTVFLLEIGQASWPQIFLYVQIFGLIFIFLTNFLKTKQTYFFHRIVIFIFLLSSLLFATSPHFYWGIMAIATMMFVTDTIGDIVATDIVSRGLSPLAYKTLSPKIVSTVTAASVLSSLLAIPVLKANSHFLFSFILSISLIIHFLFFYQLTKKLKLLRGLSNKKLYQENFAIRLKETFSYIFKNPMAFFIFIFIIWGQLAKFFSEWLYVASASQVFTGKSRLVFFLSTFNIIIMLSSYIFQRYGAKKILKNLSPSGLIGIIPYSFLFISVLGIVFSSPTFGLLLNFIFVFSFKSIYMPTLRICLHSVDKEIKPRAILLMNFLGSVAILAITLLMKDVVNGINEKLIYLILISMGLIGTYFIVRFDGLYFKNLWRNITESFERQGEEEEDDSAQSDIVNPHHFFNLPHHKGIQKDLIEYIHAIKYFPYDDSTSELFEHFQSEQTSPFEKMILLLNIFLYTKNLDLFRAALKLHHQLLISTKDEEREKAYQILALIDMPEQRRIIEKGLNLNSEIIKKYCHNSLQVLQELDGHFTPGEACHKKIRMFALLNWPYLNEADKFKVNQLFQTPFSHEFYLFASLLSHPKIYQVKLKLLNCWDTSRHKLDTCLLTLTYLSSPPAIQYELQIALLKITVNPSDKDKILEFINSYLREHSTLHTESSLAIIFLWEWAMGSAKDHSYMLQSILQYTQLSIEEKAYWKDLHLEYLKKAQGGAITDLIKTVL